MIVNALKQLWQEAFHEPEDFTDLFFREIYSPNRCHCILEQGVPISALHWFDCALAGQKLAYIYAVATRKSHRGRGLGKRLMEETHGILRDQGYAGAILVPSGAALFDFYKQFGYQAATTVSRFSCQQGDTPAAIRELSPAEYVQLRAAYMPAGGVTLGDAMLRFLQGYCQFYAGSDFLLVCEALPEELWVQEFLGNPQAAPGILKALQAPKGRFRTPGPDSAFAMWLPFREDCPKPDWFGIALD